MKRRTTQRALRLLPRTVLTKTGPVDEAAWNYQPLLGAIQRKRFQLAVRLLGQQRFRRLLEIGYGSGIFQLELSNHCDELYGIDPHPMPDAVTETLRQQGVTAHLYSGDAAAMPFADGFFDCAVAVSAVEFIGDLDRACVEVTRVLQPGGIFIVVTPGSSAVVDFGLKVLTGQSAKQNFGERRQAVVPTLLKHFDLQSELAFPAFTGALGRLYTALKLSKRR